LNIGIIFHGHLRSFRDTHQAFRVNVLNKLEHSGHKYKIFIHTWEKEEFTTKTWHEGAKEIKVTSLKEVKHCYKDCHVKIEKQVLKTNTRKIFGRSYEAIKSVWYSFYQSFLMLKDYENNNNIKFDAIIVTRPDVQHSSSIFLDELENLNYLWQCQVFAKKSASDVFLFGPSDFIEKALCQFYLNFDSLHKVEKLKKFNKNEHVFNEFIQSKVKVKTSQYCMPRDWRILRSWWTADHFVGNKKWDKKLAIKDISSNQKYIYFRRNNDK